MTIAIRVRLLERLMERIKPIPDDWVIGGRKPNGNANGSGSVEMETLPCESWEELVDVCKKAMKWTEGLDRGFSVCLAAILGTGSVGSQLWIRLIGPPSCGKSTLCEALSTNKTHVKALSTMRGFHSGHRDDSGTNKSVVLELKGKTLITKDADSMVKSPNWPQIMGEARDLFDRVSRTNYRNGMGMDSEGINMTWIMCGTGSGMAGSDMNELGARFVDCIMMEGIDEDLEREINMSVVNRAFKNVKTRSNGTMTTQLNPDMVKMMQMTGGYIEYLHDNAEFLLSNVETDEYVANQIVNLATYSAYLRARPSLKQQEKTEREFSARLVEQYARLAICLAAARGQTTIDKRVLEIVVKCAMDTSSGRTTEIVKYLHEAGDEGLELRALAILTSQSSQEERKLLQFLRKLGAVELWQDKAHGNRMAWRLTPRLSRLYAEVASYG